MNVGRTYTKISSILRLTLWWTNQALRISFSNTCGCFFKHGFNLLVQTHFLSKNLVLKFLNVLEVWVLESTCILSWLNSCWVVRGCNIDRLDCLNIGFNITLFLGLILQSFLGTESWFLFCSFALSISKTF